MMKKGMKRLVSGLLAAAMVLTGIGTNTKTASANESTMQNYVYDGYEVTFMVTSAWDGAFNAEVKIANTGDEVIYDWALEFDFEHEIQNMWNATVVEHSEDNYVVKNSDWNANIKPGEGAGFGMTVQCEEDIIFPDSFSFVMEEESVTAQSYSAEFTLYSDWGTGCNGAIILSNLTDEGIENWQLEFDYDREIVNISNAVIVSCEQGHYVIKNAEYNADIAGNSSVHIGIVAGEGAAEERPENFTMQQTVVGDATTGTEGGSGEALEEEKNIALYVLGEYDSENKILEITWFTNAENGSFEIMYSTDNKVYTLLDTVVGEITYQRAIEEDFGTKYIKVVYVGDDNERSEAVPFVLLEGDNGYAVYELDSDNDSMPDEDERMYGTDINIPDSDGDGLTDYQEIYCTETDPTVYDSVTEGIADAQVDIDNDTITNIDELRMETNPRTDDSDMDGLNDYEELYVYITDPNIDDTDGDTLIDGDEVMIGLDPNNPATFDVPDAEYKVKQEITADSDVFEKINSETSPLKISLDIVAAGYVEGNISVKETEYATIIQNDALLGVATQLEYDDTENIETVTVKFEIAEEYVKDELEWFPVGEELEGIKRFNIFKYFENLNMLLPIETEVDVDNNVIYATTDELGIYCVMDMEIWLASFDVEAEEDSSAIPAVFATRTLSDNMVYEGDMSLNSGIGETYVSVEENALLTLDEQSSVFSSRIEQKHGTPIDIVFLLQSAGTSMYDFLLQKEMIANVMAQVYGEYEDVRVCIVHYKENEAMISSSFNYNVWQPATTYLDTALRRVEYTLTDTYCNRGAAFSMMNTLELRDNAAKFVFHLANGNSGIQAGFFSELDVCAEKNINYTEILPMGFYYSDPGFVAMLQAAIEKTRGLSLTYTDETPDVVYNHIVNNVAPEQVVFDVVLATGWKHIVLDGVLDPNNGIDTDNDTLSDWREVNTDRISWEVDGTVVLPTLQECIDYPEKTYVSNGLTRFLLSEVSIGSKETLRERINQILSETYILPIISDPTEKDTDHDGYMDDVDLNALIEYKTPIILLHGLNDNTVCFGVNTLIAEGMNTDYGSEYTKKVRKGEKQYLYTDCKSHRILSIEDGKLGAYLASELSYSENKNLFAFNYPNHDMVQFNGVRLQKYIEDLISTAQNDEAMEVVDAEYLFATKEDKAQGNTKFILIGHSMGGLVSRYYIENIGTTNVERLITIDTPHYGSGLADTSDRTGNLIKFSPSIFDLNTGSTLFGGKEQKFDYAIGNYRPDTIYALRNQSPALKGNQNCSVAYYAIGGYDVGRGWLGGELGQLAEQLKNTVFAFEFTRDVSSKEDYKASINVALYSYSLVKCGQSSRLDLGDVDGDNTVDHMSQFAVRFKDDSVEYQELKRTAMVVNSRRGSGLVFPFHNSIHKERCMHEYVGEFIYD